MTRSDRVIADLVSALDAIDQAASSGQPLAYIQGMARQAQDNANVYRTRNSDGYLVMKDDDDKPRRPRASRRSSATPTND